MTKQIDLKESDFPEGTEFLIKEFIVPLTYYPPEGNHNWYGGSPRKFDPARLNATNYDRVDFEEWVVLVKED